MPYTFGMAHGHTEHPLRKWRKAKGFTLAHCANGIGTSRQVWSDWERGCHRPGPVFMPRIREFTSGAISADDFFPSFDEAA